jgi:hypothetical protein
LAPENDSFEALIQQSPQNISEQYKNI